MTSKELAKKVLSAFPDLDYEVALNLTNSFFETLKDGLKDGYSVEIRGFGAFEPRLGKGVIFTNPKNKQRYYVKRKRRVVFRNGIELTERLNIPFDAGLDLGTQTFRLILGKYFDGIPMFLLRERINVRLGENLCSCGEISEAARERGLEALGRFKEVLGRFEVRQVKAVGTAVFRQAKNAEDFLREIEERFGLKVEVIDPHQEAGFTLEGVRFGLMSLGLDPTTLMVVDVGGGSTEIIYYKKGKEPITFSVDLGVVTLRDFFCLRYPPSSKTVQSLRDYLRDRLVDLPYIRPEVMVITGGSASLIGALDLKLSNFAFNLLHGHSITVDRLAKMGQKLFGLTLSQLSKVRGMERGREDLALPALCFYLELLSYFKLNEAIISEFGILEATLLSCWKL